MSLSSGTFPRAQSAPSSGLSWPLSRLALRAAARAASLSLPENYHDRQTSSASWPAGRGAYAAPAVGRPRLWLSFRARLAPETASWPVTLRVRAGRGPRRASAAAVQAQQAGCDLSRRGERHVGAGRSRVVARTALALRRAIPKRRGRLARGTRRSAQDLAPGNRRLSEGAMGRRVPSICLTEACTVAQYRAVDGLLERLVAVIRVASPWSSIARRAPGGAPPVRVGCSGGSSNGQLGARTHQADPESRHPSCYYSESGAALCIGTLDERRDPPRSEPPRAATRREVRGFDALTARVQRGALPLPRGCGRRIRGCAYGTPHQVARHWAVREETTSYIPQKNAFAARRSVTSRGARAWDAINYVSAAALFSPGGVLSRGAQCRSYSLSRGAQRPLDCLSRGARRPLMFSRGARRPRVSSRGAQCPRG